MRGEAGEVFMARRRTCHSTSTRMSQGQSKDLVCSKGVTLEMARKRPELRKPGGKK